MPPRLTSSGLGSPEIVRLFDHSTVSPGLDMMQGDLSRRKKVRVESEYKCCPFGGIVPALFACFHLHL